MTNKNNNEKELLSYEDRQKWFRYHMHNSKVNEENAWKQINEMIRTLYKEEECSLGFSINSFKKIIEKIYYDNQDMFKRNWIESENGNMYLDYNSTIGLIYRNLDQTNLDLIEKRYQKVNNIKPDTEEQNKGALLIMTFNNKFENSLHTIETEPYLYDMGQLSNYSFCVNCTVLFFFDDDLPIDIYEIKKEYYNLFFCERCYIEIREQHSNRGTKFEGKKSLENIIGNPELK